MMKFLFIFAVGVLFGQAVCRPDGDGTNDITVHWIPFERAPYMALVHVNEDPKCGASIIQEQFVLTAAHCCQHPFYQIKVLVGAERIRNGLFVPIDRANVHEKYDNLNKDYNICIIKLREPLTFGPTIAKIALADKDVDLSTGVSVNATGWGGYHIGDPLMLLQVQMPLSANERCGNIHKWNMTERMICAGQIDSNACPTGAGNPLTVGGVQVGLLSWGAVCFRPAIHTNVAALGDWLRGQMSQLQ